MYQNLFLPVIITLFLSSCLLVDQELKRHEYNSAHMGTQFRIVLYATDESLAGKASNAAFERIEELNNILSDYLEESELNMLSRSSGSGHPVQVSEPLYKVLKHSIEVSEKTGGYFDMTVGPYSQIWRGIRRELDPSLPGQDELSDAGKSIGYNLIKMDEEKRSVKLLKEDMRLDPGGIAKGFASDEALKVLGQFGIRRAFVDGGGDISTGDAPPDKKGWSIAIPVWNNNEEPDYVELLLANKAIATSGDLFQFVEIDGRKYSHIIDPKTGLGITDRIQVTVIAANGMDADAYASAMSVMGLEKAKDLVTATSTLEALIQRVENNEIKIWKSDGFGPER